ncbi:MAG: tRNA (cytidine(34)-2'-O)-methyltransferase [Parachlamydiales bacterium]
MKIILFNPQIPHNTGAIVRLCAVTGCSLLLVPPLGFSLANRHLKRAGLDYWEGVQVDVMENLEELLEEKKDNFFFFSSKAQKLYSEVSYTQDSWLIFGSETTGLPPHFREKWPESFVTLPMVNGTRCLNLANSASIGVYEAWRQIGFSY